MIRLYLVISLIFLRKISLKFMKKFISTVLLVLSGLCFCSCIHDPDSDYYAGLIKIQEGRPDVAMRLFRQSARNGSKYVARRSYEELTNLGNISDRLNACQDLVEKYDDDDARLIAAKQYFSNNEETKLLNLTTNLDYKTCSNQLAALRFKVLYNLNDVRFFNEIYDWFVQRPLSQSHFEIYKMIDWEKIPEMFVQKESIISFRMAVYRRSFTTAYEKIGTLEDFPLCQQMISDYGKTCLYGSPNYLLDAQKMEKMIPSVKGKEEEFYVNFYVARLYEKAENYFTLVEKHYLDAMEVTRKEENYDNALWYLLNYSLKRSSDKAIQYIKDYCKKWHNPDYFSDLFNTLSPIMLSEGKWNEFYDLYQAVDGYASDEVVAKFAYIYGRLVQEGFAIQSIDDTHKSDADAAFTRALTSGTDVYYKVMALTQLGIAGEQAEEVLCLNKITSGGEIDTDAEKLLLGYATYGIPQKIYSEWLNFYGDSKRKISYEAGKKLASFLRDCGDVKEEYYPQALRIAAKVIAKTDFTINKKDLELLYPRNFNKIISKYCAEYNIPEEILYSLIRSESFFDSKIVSSAGAIGLSQLMDSTASDVAKKLKLKEFDLRDAEVNVQLGSFYLNELHTRLEDDWLLAFFSYNTGITRIRRWGKSLKAAFNNRSYLPEDLFLEIIPYQETREYGRKLVGAASMYGWLYSDKDVGQVVKEIVK